MNLINKVKLKSLILCTIFLTNSSFLMAAGKISSGATISMGGSTGLDASADWHRYQTLAKYVIGVSLFLSLIIVIYHVSNNTSKAKTAIVSWLIAVVIYCIAIDIFS